MQSAKNLMSSQATSDLGLGDMLQLQVEDEAIARKKKLLAAGQNSPASYGDATLNSPAVMSLLQGRTF